jgi:hypothetical protein
MLVYMTAKFTLHGSKPYSLLHVALRDDIVIEWVPLSGR